MTGAQHHGGRKAIIAAFLANLGIAIAKFVGFLATGAASLLAEAIHSVADTSNQGLLLFGTARSRRPATRSHPFGYGRERYFWSFVVAVVLFTGGGLFALFEGEEKLRKPHEVSDTGWAIAILVVAIVLESMSLRTAVRESRPAKVDGESWWAFVRRVKVPELPVVLLEDTGALLGLTFALFGVGMAELTDNARWDAVGSLAIGSLLVVIALVLAAEMKSFLIGESAGPEQVDGICAALGATAGVTSIVDLRTEHVGPDSILVVGRIAVDPELDTDTVASIVDDAKRAIRARVPAADLIYLEPTGDSPPPASAARSRLRRSSRPTTIDAS